ncbi:MAG: bacteriorhodopsin [Halobacteriales archaeon]|nr:bacteriorhodopsin [Halobacteriales archaeon]
MITIFITAIAATSYFSMATGYGLIEVELATGEVLDIYWARYADWLFTTPLLLLDIALLAGADRNTIATLVGLDAAMHSDRLAGALARSSALNRMLWWGISTAFMIAVLFFLVRTLSGQAARQSSAVAATFSKLRTMILVLWSFYPIVRLLGTESTISVLTLTQETAAFAVLDVLAKVGFGFVLLRSREAMDDVSASAQAAD